MAELASSAGSSGPSRSTCGRAVAMSVVIAANGRARSAKVRSAPMKSLMTVASPVLGNRCVLVCCRVRAWASSPPGKTRSRDIRAHRCDSRLAALLGCMASTDAVERADRGAGHDVGRDVALAERLQHPDLDGAQA